MIVWGQRGVTMGHRLRGEGSAAEALSTTHTGRECFKACVGRKG
jgi:hypothetical protein